MRKLICFLIVTVFFVTGCSQKQVEEETKNYVLKINDEEVSVEEFNIYLYETSKMFEQLGGADIWETDFDGKSAEQVAIDNAVSSVIVAKTIKNRAKLRGIVLDDNRQQDIFEGSALFYSELDEQTIQKFGITEELYRNVLLENALYDEVYDDTVKDFVPNMDGFEVFYEANRDYIDQLYYETMGNDKELDEETRRSFGEYYYRNASMEEYFFNEYKSWESQMTIDKNNEILNEITIK